MSLRSKEKQLKREHRKLLRQRRNQLEKEHFSFAGRLGLKARRVKQRIANVHRRRVQTFRSDMLDGHPANVADQVKRVIAAAYQFAEARGTVCTVTSTTGGVHSSTSHHFHRPLGWAVDLIFATEQLMSEFQDFLVQHSPNGDDDFLELFGPANWHIKNGTFVGSAFPDHRDHDHIAPDVTFRLVAAA